MALKGAVLIAMIVVFVWELLLRLLDKRAEGNPVPKNVQDVYDAETYQKWRSYHAEKNRLGMARGIAAFMISFLLMALNAYSAFASLFPKTLFFGMLAVLLLSLFSSLPLLPFDYADTMRIEEKYGFNRSSKQTFWTDQVKQYVVELLMMLVIGLALMGLHQALGDWLIVAFAGVMTLLVLAISFLYPVFSRLFNKFTPLEEGELRDRLVSLMEKHGYQVRAIQVMDASRRSTKSNAYFTGFGRMKTIVLYDTLIEAMTPDEICGVFAHEMGHGLHHDTLRQRWLSFLQMLILGVLAWLTLRTDALFAAFGFEGINYGFALELVMSVEFALIAPLFSLITSAVSRKAEYGADAQAVAEGYADALISALKKLARENFADLSPDPLLVRLTYSHPTIHQRIEAIRKVQKNSEMHH